MPGCAYDEDMKPVTEDAVTKYGSEAGFRVEAATCFRVTVASEWELAVGEVTTFDKVEAASSFRWTGDDYVVPS